MRIHPSVRWRILTLLFAATTINYIDRNVLSFTMIDVGFKKEMMGVAQDAPLTQAVSNEFKIQMGYVDSAFKFTYAFGFLLMGWLIDRIGARRGFSLGILLWSMAASLHALAGSLGSLRWFRASLGIGEAANFPAAIKTVAEWFPQKERALATGLFNAGANVGIIVTALLVPFLTLRFGWRASFLVTGSLGILLLLAWWKFYHKPENHPALKDRERIHIQSDRDQLSIDTQKIPWIQLLTFRQTWAFAVGKFMADPIWWFYLTWLPDFFNSNEALDQKLDLKTIGLPFLVIYIVSDVGSVFFGWLSSTFLNMGWSLNRARKTTLFICALCVVPISLASTTHSIYVAVALISLATAAHTGWAATMYTFAADLFPRSAVASVTGIGGMSGALGGVLLAAVAGLIRVRYGYLPLFIIASSSYLIGWCLIHWILPTMKKVELPPVLEVSHPQDY
ncbi:MFS transporter [Spirosoma endbachense]|uniref:MFS transporter n=1 Tax=Spirosoma endbachense TaxID=2666025 RepID=A0A6P1W5T7_9BACT|nr:MFS transporter [Spirosoma endbachense]QHW00386.1 MFS transporter [Spirosoma endbachense]